MTYQTKGAAGVVLPSAARTADATSDTFRVPDGAQGLIVVVDVTADPAAASVTFTIRGVDPISGSTWDLLTSAAVDSVETRVLRVSPHLTASVNLIANDILPAWFEVFADATDTDSLTYSVAYQAV